VSGSRHVGDMFPQIGVGCVDACYRGRHITIYEGSCSRERVQLYIQYKLEASLAVPVFVSMRADSAPQDVILSCRALSRDIFDTKRTRSPSFSCNLKHLQNIAFRLTHQLPNHSKLQRRAATSQHSRLCCPIIPSRALSNIIIAAKRTFSTQIIVS